MGSSKTMGDMIQSPTPVELWFALSIFSLKFPIYEPPIFKVGCLQPAAWLEASLDNLQYTCMYDIDYILDLIDTEW